MLFGQQIDAFVGDSGRLEQFGPDIGALLIARYAVLRVTGEDGHVDPVGIQTDDVDQERPEHRDLLGLEIASQAPVSEHLEERGVAVVADLVDVLGANARLDVGEHGAGGVWLAEQVVE